MTPNANAVADAVTAVEREVKLEVDPDFLLPDLSEVAGGVLLAPLSTVEMVADYYDTSDLRLLQRGMTLRRREERSEEGSSIEWTLKLPVAVPGATGSTLDRTEVNWPSSGLDTDVPPGVHHLLRGIVRHASLRQVTELATTRRRLAVRRRSGELLGELDDDTVSVHGGERDGWSFRQLELELSREGGAVVEAVVDRLIDAGADRRETGPKVDRVLRGDRGDEDPGPPRGVGHGGSLAGVVEHSIAGALDRILDHEYRIRLGDADPEPVHQARVATRRLRSDLKTFAPALDPIWVAHVRADLRWLGAALGTVRDLDVLDHRLVVHAEGLHGTDRWVFAGVLEALDAERMTAREALLDVLGTERYVLLLDRLATAAARPPYYDSAGIRGTGPGLPPPQQLPASQLLPRLVGKPWRKLRREVAQVGPDPTDQQLHGIRIRAKQLRYAAEAAAPAVGKPARRMATAAERLQAVLGEHHDTVAAEAWLRQAAAGAPPAACLAIGQLIGAEKAEREAHRRQWPAAWARLDRAQRRRWLHHGA